MAAFGGFIVTNKGRALLAKVQAGAQIAFTRLAIGDGSLSGQQMVAMTNLISLKKSLTINKIKPQSDGKITIGSFLTNTDITVGFYFRELGVFANDPDEGEVLYAYANAGAGAEYIPAGGGPDIVQKYIDVIVIFSSSSNVSAVIDQSLIFAGRVEFESHMQSAVLDHPDGSVTTAKLAAKAVTQAKIGDKAVGQAQIADKAVGSGQLANGAATDTVIGNRTIDDTVTAASGADTPTRLWSKLANIIKQFSGESAWWMAPAVTLKAVYAHIISGSAHGSTSAATASAIVQRDANGRAQVAAPVDAADIARKAEVDTVQSSLTAHTLDSVKHITAAERTDWNAKETTTGSQSKASAAETNAKAYVDASWKQKWPFTSDTGSHVVNIAAGEDFLVKINPYRTCTFYTNPGVIGMPSSSSGRGWQIAQASIGHLLWIDTANRAYWGIYSSSDTSVRWKQITDAADFDSHLADIVKHITAAERADWNARETTTGSQTKINAAIASLKSEADPFGQYLLESSTMLSVNAKAVTDLPDAYPKGTSIMFISTSAGNGASWGTELTGNAIFGVVVTYNPIDKVQTGFQHFYRMHSSSSTTDTSQEQIWYRCKRDANADWQPFISIENTIGSQAKATQALTDAKTYTDTQTASTKTAAVTDAKTYTDAQTAAIKSAAQMSKITTDTGRNIIDLTASTDDLLAAVIAAGNGVKTIYATGSVQNTPSASSIRAISFMQGGGPYGFIYAVDTTNRVFSNYCLDGVTWRGWKQMAFTDGTDSITITNNTAGFITKPSASTSTQTIGLKNLDADGILKWITGHVPSTNAWRVYDVVNGRSALEIAPASGANDFKYIGNTVWHAGNDGAGSGQDADLLDGKHGSEYVLVADLGTRNGANGYAGLDANSKVAAAQLPDGTTSAKGAVQLSTSTSSTSTSLAATASAVKSAYDVAAAALPKAGGEMSGNPTIKNANPSVVIQPTADIAGTTGIRMKNAAGIDMFILGHSSLNNRFALYDYTLPGTSIAVEAGSPLDNGFTYRGNKVYHAGNALIYLGSGSPVGVVSAPVGSIYQRTDGGASTSLYIKESGTGNTGWRAV